MRSGAPKMPFANPFAPAVSFEEMAHKDNVMAILESRELLIWYAHARNEVCPPCRCPCLAPSLPLLRLRPRRPRACPALLTRPPSPSPRRRCTLRSSCTA